MYNIKNHLFPNSEVILNEISMQGVMKSLNLKRNKSGGITHTNGKPISAKTALRLKHIKNRLDMSGIDRYLDHHTGLDGFNWRGFRKRMDANDLDGAVHWMYHRIMGSQHDGRVSTALAYAGGASDENNWMYSYNKKFKDGRLKSLFTVPANTNGKW